MSTVEPTWTEMLVALAAVLGPLIGAALGALLLAYTPMRGTARPSRRRRTKEISR